MNPRKRSRRARVSREVGPVQLELDLDLDLGPEPPPQPRPRRRVTVTRPAATYTDAAGSQTYTPETEEESTDAKGE